MISKKFYSISVFEKWKKSNKDTTLIFEDFSNTEVIDGFILSKDKKKALAVLNKDSAYILVKSNRLPILNDFYYYAEHINELLKDEYVRRAKDELKIIETRFTDPSVTDSGVIQTFLSIDRYIASAEKGENVLFVERPSRPLKVAPNALFISLTIFNLKRIREFHICYHVECHKTREQLNKACKTLNRYLILSSKINFV